MGIQSTIIYTTTWDTLHYEQKYNNLWVFRAQYGIINSGGAAGGSPAPSPPLGLMMVMVGPTIFHCRFSSYQAQSMST